MFANITTNLRGEDLRGTTTEIANLQRLSIAISLKQTCSRLSQETEPSLIADLAANIIASYLTDENRSMVARFRDSISPYLLIKSAIDVNGLPDTPTDDRSPAEGLWRLPAATLLGLLKICGANARSFQDEMGGRLFHMVMPAQNDSKSRLRSTKALNFHTEVVNGYFIEECPNLGAPIAPEIFSLACLRNPHSVPTTVLPLAEVLPYLGQDTMRTLKLPLYMAKSQSSFDRDIVIDSVPVLIRLDGGGLGIRYSHSKLAAKTAAAASALAELRDVIEIFDSSCSVTLQPGDVLILNNKLCLHGRGEVASSSQFKGSDRWLLRLYGYDEATLPYLLPAREEGHVMRVLDTQ